MSINNMAIKNLSLHFQRVFHSSVSTSARRFDVFMVRFLCGLALLLIAAFVFYAIPESAPVIRMLDLFDKHLMVLLNYDGGSTLDAFWYTLLFRSFLHYSISSFRTGSSGMRCCSLY